jgi:uncharacterized membrane protein
MLRKTIIALFAVAAVGLVSPSVASARGGGGFHGGGHGGGGFHGGFRGGGFRGGGFGGFGLYGPYAYGGYGYPYSYGGYYADGGCYLIRQRVMTRYGWRLRRVQVCD